MLIGKKTSTALNAFISIKTYQVCKSVFLLVLTFPLRLKTDILITTFASELVVNALNVKGGMLIWCYFVGILPFAVEVSD